jgi:hypothetical protein
VHFTRLIFGEYFNSQNDSKTSTAKKSCNGGIQNTPTNPMAGGTSDEKPIVFSISPGNFAGFAISRITTGALPSDSTASQSRKPRRLLM